METFLAFYYTTLVILVFFIFSFIIAGLGYITIKIVSRGKQKLWKLTNLEKFFIYYVIGLSIYVLYLLILDFMKSVTIFTGLLPLIIVEISFYGFFLYKRFKNHQKSVNRDSNQKQDKKLKRKLIQTGLSKERLILLGIIFLIILFQFRELYPTLVSNSSLLSSDTYFWTGNTYYILDQGYIDRKFVSSVYPRIFSLICASHLLFYPNKIFLYFFMKFASIPLLIMVILGIFSIAKRFFKKKSYLIYFSLISLLFYNYFLQRVIMFLPSAISSLLILISLMIFSTDAPNTLNGLIIPITYLIHPLSAFFLISLVIAFYLAKFFRNDKKKTLKDRFKDTSFLIEPIIIMSLIFLSILLLFLRISILKDMNYFQVINKSYQFFLRKISFQDLNPSSEAFLTGSNNSVRFSIIRFLSDLFVVDILIELILERTIGFFFIFAIIGIFTRSKSNRESIKDGKLLIKIGVLLIITFFYVPYLFHLKIINSNSFYAWAKYRILESFAPHLIILSAFGVEFVIDRSNQFADKIKRKIIKKKRRYEKTPKDNNKYKKPLSNAILNQKRILILLLIGSSTTFYLTREKFWYDYYYEYHYMDNYFYIFEHIPEGTRIAVRDYSYDESEATENRVYELLNSYETVKYNVTKQTTYSNFTHFCTSEQVQYVLMKRPFFNQTFLEKFDEQNHFELVYRKKDNPDLYALYRFNAE